MCTPLDSARYRAADGNLAGSQFRDVNLSAGRFNDVNLRGAAFLDVALTNAAAERAPEP